ncbi:MAG: hypothetical protein ACPGSB_06445 [Opitutales bacterium]
MKLALTLIARLSLVLTVVPAFLHLFGMLSIEAVKWIMAISCVTWFISAPLLQREHEKTGT